MSTAISRVRYNAWLCIKDHPQCCPQWRDSFRQFCRDIKLPPQRKTPLKLIHLDTLKELGPGNVAWMDRVHSKPHVRFEKHRQLMAEINHPVPPYVPLKVFFDPPRCEDHIVPTARQVRLEAFHEEIVEKRERQTRPRVEVIPDPLDQKVVHRGRLITIRKLVEILDVNLETFKSALRQYGTSSQALQHIHDEAARLRREAWEQQQAEAAAARLVAQEKMDEIARAEAAARRAQWEDAANPRWMALKIVPAVFDGDNFKNSPFEAVSEEYANADRVLKMLKEGAHQGLVKVLPHEGTPYACFGIVNNNQTTFAHAEDYIVAVRHPYGYRLEVVPGPDFKTFVVDH